MSNVTFGLWWVAVFVSFPVAGLAAKFSVGAVTTPVKGLLAGAITGAVIGTAQWLVLRDVLAMPVIWIAATLIGAAVGLAAAIAVCGIEYDGNALLWRGLVTGLAIGVAQAIVLTSLQGPVPAAIWVACVTLGWSLGWWIARAIGVDLSPHYSVFGSVGAILLQAVTAVVIVYMRAR